MIELSTDIKRLIKIRRSKKKRVKRLEELYSSTLEVWGKRRFKNTREIQLLRADIRKNIREAEKYYTYTVKREIINKWKIKLKLGK